MHFTYAKPSGDLAQGDILRRTPALEQLLGSVHPYYSKADYTHFIVVTQTCDLVRRTGEACAAPYTTLCAVRPLSGVILREARSLRRGLLVSADANNRKHRDRLMMFLKRLLNNNNHEYFYLHEDGTVGLTDRMCAYLRLSVAVRTTESYETLLGARIAGLDPSFQAKLGWLVSNIYGRVGTEDWSPGTYKEGEWTDFVGEILDEVVVWLDDDKVKAAEKAVTPAQVAQSSKDEVVALIQGQAVIKRKDQVIAAILDDLAKQQLIAVDSVEASRKLLANSTALKALLPN